MSKYNQYNHTYLCCICCTSPVLNKSYKIKSNTFNTVHERTNFEHSDKFTNYT